MGLRLILDRRFIVLERNELVLEVRSIGGFINFCVDLLGVLFEVIYVWSVGYGIDM